MPLVSAREYARQHNKSPALINRLIAQGRIPAVRVGRTWAIDSDTPYPSDRRVKSGAYKDWRKPKTQAPTE